MILLMRGGIKMEKLNNPKTLVNIIFYTMIISIISLLIFKIYLVFDVPLYKEWVTDYLLNIIKELLYIGFPMNIIYFYKLKSNKAVNLKLLNNLLFINYVVGLICLFTILDSNLFIITINPIINISIIIYLALVFYGNKRILKTHNFIFVLSLILYVFVIISNNYSNNILGTILIITSHIYILPMVCYMRLYAKHKLGKEV